MNLTQEGHRNQELRCARLISFSTIQGISKAALPHIKTVPTNAVADLETLKCTEMTHDDLHVGGGL